MEGYGGVTYVKAETTTKKSDMAIIAEKIEALDGKIEGLRNLMMIVMDEVQKIKNPEKVNPVVDLTPILPEKPFTDLEVFMEFERGIANDEEQFARLVKQISEQNALNSERFIKRCWRRLLSDDCAQKFCWKGSGGKNSSRTLSCTAAIRVAYETKYPYGTQNEFEKTSILFFQQARNRLSKKMMYTSIKSENMEKNLENMADITM